MADQKLITLYEGNITPQNIVIRDLPIADIPAGSVIYFYTVSPVTGLSGNDPRVITLYEGNVLPTNVVIQTLADWTVSPANVIIVLKNPLVAETEVPPTGYYGILKRWVGSWVKALLKTYLTGTWQSKSLKRWDGSIWKLIDTTGV